MNWLKRFAYSIIFLTVLCFFSWTIYHSATGGNLLGPLKKPLLKFVSFPQTVKNILTSPEVTNTPRTFLPVPENFETVNKLEKDLFGLITFWDNVKKHWRVEMVNLKTNERLYTWFFKKESYNNYGVQFHNSRPSHSVLLPDKQLLLNMSSTSNLMRIDSNSNIIWHNSDLEFHHSMNIDHEGNLWTCASDLFDTGSEIYTGGLVKNLTDELISYREDYLVKVDTATGKTIWTKGVGELLLDNGYKGILYGFTLFDPIHINDIEPALSDSPYWQQGDLFISIRNRSLVFLYRPSENKIVQLFHGPFINQHDVDILSNHEISIFNNNHIASPALKIDNAYTEVNRLISSEVIYYDFETKQYQVQQSNLFQAENIVTKTQGLSHTLTDGSIFVEAQNTGIYHLIKDDEIIYKSVFYTPDSNYVHMPSWIRIFETNPFNQEQ